MSHSGCMIVGCRWMASKYSYQRRLRHLGNLIFLNDYYGDRCWIVKHWYGTSCMTCHLSTWSLYQFTSSCHPNHLEPALLQMHLELNQHRFISVPIHPSYPPLFIPTSLRNYSITLWSVICTMLNDKKSRFNLTHFPSPKFFFLLGAGSKIMQICKLIIFSASRCHGAQYLYR
jgi:hypothetical protein